MLFYIVVATAAAVAVVDCDVYCCRWHVDIQCVALCVSYVRVCVLL